MEIIKNDTVEPLGLNIKMSDNILLDTDSYKVSHWLQYPDNTTAMQSYIEARGGDFKETVFFGLQVFLKAYLQNPITQADIDEAEAYYAYHLEGVDPNNIPEDHIVGCKDGTRVTEWETREFTDGMRCYVSKIPVKTEPCKVPIINFDGLRQREIFNKKGWQYILEKYNGILPIKISAVPEGLVVPTKNVLVTIESDDPEVFWLVSYLETALLRAVWYPTTVATISWNIKQLIRGFLNDTCDDPEAALLFKLHDFGARGVSSKESAMLGGMSHLVNFMGTDTVSALVGANLYYNEPMAGFSIPAAEHSTMTARGPEGEWLSMKQMLDVFAKPGTLLACVSDSYDIYAAIDKIWGEKLRQQIIDSGAILVVRPDSGDPVEVAVKCVQKLDDKFGHTVNKKGYKVLNNVRVMYGDGTCYEMIEQILTNLKALGYSAENIAFGMGGALLQKLNRDTQAWAMKCCAMLIDGNWVDIYKQPITDPGKNSKRGRVTLIQNVKTKEYKTSTYEDWEAWGQICKGFSQGSEWVEVMQPVYENGKILVDWTLAEVRANSNL